MPKPTTSHETFCDELVAHPFDKKVDVQPWTVPNDVPVASSSALPETPQEWLQTLFPGFVGSPFAEFHDDCWAWVDAIPENSRPAAYIGVWFRGGGKSSTAEMAAVRIGALRRRRYVLYVSGTQEKADKHVETIGTLLETPGIAKHYPQLAQRRLNKYGNSRGWRRNRLWTDDGFIIDAAGLDAGVRGLKAEDARPDMIIIDDVDEHDDSPETTRKRMETLTKAILPAGNRQTLAILAIQNIVKRDGVFDQIVKGKVDVLSRRRISGPVPAIEDLTYEIRDGRAVITGGTPTWEGFNLEQCQRDIEDYGLFSFLAECQHDLEIMGDRLVYGRMPDGVLIFEPRRNVKEASWRWKDSKWRIGGFDQGGRDPSALSMCGVAGDERIHRYRELRFQGPMAASQIAAWFRDIEQDEGAQFDAILCDPSAPALIETLSADYGLPAIPANNERAMGVAVVREMFLTNRLTIDPACKFTVQELGSYWEVERPEGSTARSSFETRTGAGHHADLLDVLRYECMGVYEGFPRNRSNGGRRLVIR